MKLYCIKDFKPGEWLTKGKVYEVVDDIITYDDGWQHKWSQRAPYLDENLKFFDCLIPLISRPAKAGESIYPTKDSIFGRYKKGDILRVTKDDSTITATWKGVGVAYHHKDCDLYVIKNSEYLVLDGYKPEDENKGEGMKYKVGDTLCSKDGDVKKVIGIDSGMYHAGGVNYWTEDFIERKIDMFTKDDLKTGDLVVRKDNTVSMVMRDTNGYCGEHDLIINSSGENLLFSQYKDDLTSIGSREFDIMKVYRGYCGNSYRSLKNGSVNSKLKLIWQREEKRHITAEEAARIIKDKCGDEVTIDL